MLVLGLASSHAPGMFLPVEEWDNLQEVLTNGVPQPTEAKGAPLKDKIRDRERIDRGFAELRNELERIRPDALIIVGDDQTEVFARPFNPTLAVFEGPEVSGTLNIGLVGQAVAENHLTWQCDPDLARHLTAELTIRGFEPASISEIHPLGRPQAGIGHAFTRVARAVGAKELGIPIIPIFLNGYHPPLPSAKRCHDLGAALRSILDTSTKRVAVYGSGGLSHDPMGPRAGWIDQPLDRWVLRCIADGEGERLTNLFRFESDTLSGGTGEIRSWIVVAGAFGNSAATVIDYIPLYPTVTGLAFASWVPQDGESPGPLITRLVSPSECPPSSSLDIARQGYPGSSTTAPTIAGARSAPARILPAN